MVYSHFLLKGALCSIHNAMKCSKKVYVIHIYDLPPHGRLGIRLASIGVMFTHDWTATGTAFKSNFQIHYVNSPQPNVAALSSSPTILDMVLRMQSFSAWILYFSADRSPSAIWP